MSRDVVVEESRPDADDGVALIGLLDAELLGRYPAQSVHGLHAGEEKDPRLLFLVARLNGEPVGCGALRELSPRLAEVKRMYVHAGCRNQGIGAKILAALEAAARARGYERLVLETGIRQPEAVQFYQRQGYSAIDPYGEYVGNPFSVCMEKVLS